MQLPLAIQNLKLHNQWRRGAEIDPLDPKVIGESIDAVVEAYQNSMVDPNSISEEDAHLVQLYVDTIRGVNCGRRTGATHRMIDLYAHRLLMNGEVVVTCNYKPDPEENRSECEYIYNAILKRIAHEQESFAFEANEERLTIKRTFPTLAKERWYERWFLRDLRANVLFPLMMVNFASALYLVNQFRHSTLLMEHVVFQASLALVLMIVLIISGLIDDKKNQ